MTSRYPYRWRDFVGNLSAEFPQLSEYFRYQSEQISSLWTDFIATTNTFNPILAPNPSQYDVHVYQTPSEYAKFTHSQYVIEQDPKAWFAQNAFIYDGFQVVIFNNMQP